MSQQQLQTAFAKSDQVVTIEFLISAASALYGHNRLAQKDSDQFKVVVSGLQATLNENQSFLSSLIQQDVTFTKILANRWSTRAFIENLFRMSSAVLLDQIQAAAAGLVTDLCKKTELFFNQTFVSRGQKEIRSIAQAPEFLLGFSDRIAAVLLSLKEQQITLKTYSPSSSCRILKEDIEAEKEFAESIGFQWSDAAPLIRELEFNFLMRRVRLSLNEFVDTLSELDKFLEQNFDDVREILPRAHRFRSCLAEIDRFGKLIEFKDESTLNALEALRFEASKSLYDVTQNIVSLSADATKSMTLKGLRSTQKISFHENEPLKSAVVQQIVAKGALVQDAMAATKQLSEYCFKNDTAPALLLESELKKIHPILNEATKEIIDTTASAISGTQKSEYVSRAKKLTEIANQVAKAALVVSLILFFGACGIKTPVQSNVDVLRAEVPFRSPPPTEITSPQDEIKKDSND